jgi:alkaline phosphatase D
MDAQRRSFLLDAARWPRLPRPCGVQPTARAGTAAIRSASASPPARRCRIPSSCGPASCPIRSMRVGARRWRSPCAGKWPRTKASAASSRKGSAVAAPELAHSVHVDATGLQPDRWYWYRFMLGDAVSPVGRTRTAPAPAHAGSMLKLAVASCQHWEFGSYAAHRHIAAAAPDLVAFLGDYIYEWGPTSCASGARGAQRRIVHAGDYRARYAQYKSDPDLQAAHLAAPWIVTWDDHEVANDYAATATSGCRDFAARRAAAYQAFYEHMPLRLPPPRPLRQHPHVPALRLGPAGALPRAGRPPVPRRRCLPRSRDAAARTSVLARACPRCATRRARCWACEQEAWLARACPSSKARWNILAQQTLMAQSSQVPIVSPTAAASGPMAGMAIRWRASACSMRSAPAARSNPLVLGGDVHTFYASELRAISTGPVEGQPGDRDRVRAAPRSPRARARSSARSSTWR